ncbi:ferric reductase-like transmembrane domain-containing protein [Nakamurella flavida]|uniref:Ferric reductase-like transmembrane domain-containing protein n=1 Tax=Nakamurella flavida TaxID=363630 RepID=A0A939C5C4_9ACTN|nr:ferric reductase-like transmembrane domain-containing protein [Nakamurella flavida]
MDSSALWYLSRAAGVVALVLFTAVLVLGIATSGRAGSAVLPRAGVLRLHRSISLSALVFLALHIVSAIADGYVELGVVDVFLPFGSAWDPFWVGLGAVAVDLLLAVTITSLLRRHLPVRLWRGVHLAAYAMWPIAVAHGLGSAGGDGVRPWTLAVSGVCVLAVVGALWRWRLRSDRHPDAVRREQGRLRHDLRPAVVPVDPTPVTSTPVVPLGAGRATR